MPEKINKNKQKSKFYYDKKTKALPKLEIGQSVAVQLAPDTDKLWHFGKVVDKVKDRDYYVHVDDKNKSYRRNQVQIKPFNKADKCTTVQLPEKIEDHPRTNVVHQEASDPEPLANDNLNQKKAVEGVVNIPETPNNVNNDCRPKRNKTVPSKLKDYILY